MIIIQGYQHSRSHQTTCRCFKTPNWLPVPDNSFTVAIRMYIPEQSVLSGQWSPPPILLASK